MTDDNIHLNLLLGNDGLGLGLGGGAASNCDTLLGETHFLRECGVRDPFGRCAWVGLLQHLVDLLERETLGLGDEEVGEGERDAAESTPQEEHFRAQVGIARIAADEVWSDDSNDAVPEPVGGSREADTAGADRKREDLANDDPGGRTPGGSEEEDVDADKRNHGRDCSGVVQGLVIMRLTSSDTNDADNELSNDHAQSTPDENTTTTEGFDHIETERSGADVDESGDERNQEGVADRSQAGEEDSSEVEDKVNTGQLLHHLHQYTDSGTAAVAVALEDAALEAVGPATNVACLRDDLLFIFVVRNNLSQFILDIF